MGTRSLACIPMTTGEGLVGALTVVDLTRERQWPEALVGRLRLIAEIFQSALERQRADGELQRTLAELCALKDRLAQGNAYLRREAVAHAGFGRIIGESGALTGVLGQVDRVARTDATVLLHGETGTGKELLAVAIHQLSARRDRPMVRVNCAALPATLVESELFGREKGAYTGALTRQAGRFELAQGSTIFLDEIGDLPLDVQVKLLRVLEVREVERLGDPRPIRVNVRVIAATHQNLLSLVRAGKFREDLYYRLNVFPIAVPPLRERPEDIPRLVWAFVEELSGALGVKVEGIAAESMARLQAYAWPGNVRELRNIVERALIVNSGSLLRIEIPEVPEAVAGAPARSDLLADVERRHIVAVLERTGWRIRGKLGAAKALGLKPTTLETRAARLGIMRPDGPRPSA
jgi:formate hydrogenlyase transcriptional activator